MESINTFLSKGDLVLTQVLRRRRWFLKDSPPCDELPHHNPQPLEWGIEGLTLQPYPCPLTKRKPNGTGGKNADVRNQEETSRGVKERGNQREV